MDDSQVVQDTRYYSYKNDAELILHCYTNIVRIFSVEIHIQTLLLTAFDSQTNQLSSKLLRDSDDFNIMFINVFYKCSMKNRLMFYPNKNHCLIFFKFKTMDSIQLESNR